MSVVNGADPLIFPYSLKPVDQEPIGCCIIIIVITYACLSGHASLELIHASAYLWNRKI